MNREWRRWRAFAAAAAVAAAAAAVAAAAAGVRNKHWGERKNCAAAVWVKQKVCFTRRNCDKSACVSASACMRCERESWRNKKWAAEVFWAGCLFCETSFPFFSPPCLGSTRFGQTSDSLPFFTSLRFLRSRSGSFGGCCCSGQRQNKKKFFSSSSCIIPFTSRLVSADISSLISKRSHPVPFVEGERERESLLKCVSFPFSLSHSHSDSHSLPPSPS